MKQQLLDGNSFSYKKELATNYLTHKHQLMKNTVDVDNNTKSFNKIIKKCNKRPPNCEICGWWAMMCIYSNRGCESALSIATQNINCINSATNKFKLRVLFQTTICGRVSSPTTFAQFCRSNQMQSPALSIDVNSISFSRRLIASKINKW